MRKYNSNKNYRYHNSIIFLTIITSFIIIFSICFYFSKLGVLSFYLSINFITILTLMFDKYQARLSSKPKYNYKRGPARVPEVYLGVLCFLSGGLIPYVTGLIISHKTRKNWFKLVNICSLSVAAAMFLVVCVT